MIPALLQFDDIAVEVVLKDIRHLYLRVHPPEGRVRISAPRRMSLGTIRRFAVSRLEWIRQQQERVQARELARQREAPAAGALSPRERAAADARARERLREAVAPLLARWEPVLGVKARRLFVRRMKTKWGSCNHRTGSIRLSSELLGKPPECLEYVVVHELMHLLEPTHNARFKGLMDRFLPEWRACRRTLNGRGKALDPLVELVRPM